MMILVRVMRGDRPERPDSPFVTDQLWALIEDSWHSDPKQRPTMKFIAQQVNSSSSPVNINLTSTAVGSVCKVASV
jgi:hypothetical protein